MKIKDLRIKNALTQKQLAEKMGVSSVAISHWEQGIRRPSIKRITKLATVLNVSETKIFECFK